jgi:hypothetical protein
MKVIYNIKTTNRYYEASKKEKNIKKAFKRALEISKLMQMDEEQLKVNIRNGEYGIPKMVDFEIGEEFEFSIGTDYVIYLKIPNSKVKQKLLKEQEWQMLDIKERKEIMNTIDELVPKKEHKSKNNININ